MGIFDRFPYSSTHEMNLDFMLGKATEIAESLQEIDTHKDQAEQAATNAAQSATNAAQAAQAAADSQTAAGTSASQAAQHKANAEDAADRAEAASNLADEAVEQAQTAVTQAQTAATNASTAADGAIASAASAETRINNLAASLPEDFTELNNEVTGLKSALSEPPKNLLVSKTPWTATNNGITYSINNGVLTLNGTATANSTGRAYFGLAFESMSEYIGETLSLSIDVVNADYNGNVFISLADDAATTVSLQSAKPKTFTYASTMDSVFLFIPSGTVFSNVKIKIMLNKGTPSTWYEPSVSAVDKIDRAQLSNVERYFDKSYNLINTYTKVSQTANGITIVFDGNCAEITGTATADCGIKFDFDNKLKPLGLSAGDKLVFMLERIVGTFTGSAFISLNNAVGTSIPIDTKKSYVKAVTYTTSMNGILFYISSGATFDHTKFYLQLTKNKLEVYSDSSDSIVDKIARANVKNALMLDKSKYVLDRSMAISDTKTYTVGDGAFLFVDDARAMCYCVYNTAKSGYGEAHDILALSVFPLLQPWRAEYHQLVQEGDVIGEHTIDSIREHNALFFENTIRLFITFYENGYIHYCYCDFNTSGVRQTSLTEMKLFNGTTEIGLYPSAISQYAQSKGYSMSNRECFFSCQWNKDDDDIIWAAISGGELGDNGITGGNPIVVVSDDNGATWRIKCIVAADGIYEASVCKTGENVYLLSRPKNSASAERTKMWISTNNGTSFTSFEFYDHSTSRPQLLNYKGKLMAVYNKIDEWLPTEYCTNERTHAYFTIGEGNNISGYQEVFDIVSKYGVFYFAVIDYRNVVFMAYITNTLYYNLGGKNLVNFLRIGEMFDNGLPNEYTY